MAREARITRTVIGTKVVVMCVDVALGETVTRDFTLGHVIKEEDKILKAVAKLIEEDNVKPVHVVSVEKVEKLLGLSEADFLKYAVELDPKTRKPLA